MIRDKNKIKYFGDRKNIVILYSMKMAPERIKKRG